MQKNLVSQLFYARPTFSGGAFGNGVGVGIRKDDTELLKSLTPLSIKHEKTETLVELLLSGLVFDASM